MFEQIFKNIDNILYTDSGSNGELDYIEQTSWIIFLRYLDYLEQDRADQATLKGQTYNFILDEKYRWSSWAAPKNSEGNLDHNKALDGDDLIEFIEDPEDGLFKYLSSFKRKHQDDSDTIEYKVGQIFTDLSNKVKSGFNLREILNEADKLQFGSSQQKHELSHLYETKIKNMGNAGRNGGQYYTPRPLIRAMVSVTNPTLGETIYDGAAGSGGFLVEAYDYLLKQVKDDDANSSTDDLLKLKNKTFYGREAGNLAFTIGTMNMILHGIDAPNLVRANTLATHNKHVEDKDRYDIILANPPFGGKERKEVQQNFDIKTSETAFLFLQHFIKYLKAGGRAAIVIKNTFLSNTDNASTALRKELLESCNLHTILDMPSGTFLGAGVKTVVLFFEKGEPTKKIWYYQLDPGRNMGKTNPLNDDDLKDFIELEKTKADSENSWTVDIADVTEGPYDLSVKNPNTPEEAPLREPDEILNEMKNLDEETSKLLDSIQKLL